MHPYRFTNIKHNIELIRSRLAPETKYLAVVKANAYGHGMEAVANCALESGAAYLGVAFTEEGVRLRLAGIRADSSARSYGRGSHGRRDPSFADANGIHHRTLQLLQAHAAELNMVCRVHIKADTGMNRIGFTSEAAFTEAILLLKRCPNLVLDGLFTHFAVSELADTSFIICNRNVSAAMWRFAAETACTPCPRKQQRGGVAYSRGAV